MWIYLKDGFFSIVTHERSSDHLVVRARVKGDLERVFSGMMDEGPTFTPDADYRYRATVARPNVAKVMMNQVKLLDYDNFKANINDKERREYWYGRVWDTMVLMQDQMAVFEDIEAMKKKKAS